MRLITVILLTDKLKKPVLNTVICVISGEI